MCGCYRVHPNAFEQTIDPLLFDKLETFSIDSTLESPAESDSPSESASRSRADGPWTVERTPYTMGFLV